MASWWRRRRAGDKVHPLLRSADSLLAALDNAPSVLLVVDAEGEIVFRNRAALETMRHTLATQGEQALVVLRDTLREDVRTATRFPFTKTTPARVGDKPVHGSATYARMPGGYLVTWVDTTMQVEAGEVVRELAHELTAASSALTEAGQELVSIAGRTAERAEVVSHGSTEMSASIREIASRVTSAAASTGTAAASARQAAGSMEQLQESSRQIGSITKLITDIAEQTKLLALNATIESARAGEMGKGFAVVAGEVKELAARTSEATRQIITMIDGIQVESSQAAAGMSGIVELIDEVAEQQVMISGAVEEQTATTAEISGGMQSVAHSVQVSATAADTVLAAAASLQDQATRLSQLTISSAA